MTDRHSNGFVCIAVEQGTALLTLDTEGEEMVIGLQMPGLPRSEISIGITLGCELRDRYFEALADAQFAAGAKARAALMDDLIASSADEL
jgi:hypothetical protein